MKENNKIVIWQHGCSEVAWELIQEEGVLFGDRGDLSRCTSLSTNIEEAVRYGDIILTVYYDPTVNPKMNNCPEDFDCENIRVYEPISIDKIIKNEVPPHWREEIPLIYNEHFKQK